MRRMKDKIEASVTNADESTHAIKADKAITADKVSWSGVQDKPPTYPPSAHTHNYAGSGSVGGSANSAVKLDSSAGGATQPVYFKDGKPVATSYALNKTVPADAKFTDTWRGIQNNLTSDSTDQSLSAAQGKALKRLVDGKANENHTHSYLPLSGGTMTGRINKDTGGSWIGDRDRVLARSNYAGDSSYGAVAGIATKNGNWTMGNLGGNESLIFNYTTDSNYNAGNNSGIQVSLPAQAGIIVTSATIGGYSVNYANRAGGVAWDNVSGKPSTYTPSVHTHTKSQITDFPSSMPASDVSAWAKAATKPSYTKAEVGLGNVDNTADKDKSVKFSTSAGSATNTQYLNNDSQYMRFHWNGQSGQPTWLWGGNDASNMYVYNPSNFSVNYATTAGTALTAKNLPYSITYEGSYVGTAYRDYLYTSDPGGSTYATETNPIRTTLSKEYDVVVFLDAGKNGQWSAGTSETCPERIAFLRLMQVNEKFTESYVVMSALTSDWTRGLSRDQNSGNVNQGPVIEYGYSPKKSIKYRKTGTTIERYWTRESIKSSSGLGEPGTANSLDNGAYMLLDRAGRTYHVFGIDIDPRFFVSSHADEEGSEVV